MIIYRCQSHYFCYYYYYIWLIIQNKLPVTVEHCLSWNYSEMFELPYLHIILRNLAHYHNGIYLSVHMYLTGAVVKTQGSMIIQPLLLLLLTPEGKNSKVPN